MCIRDSHCTAHQHQSNPENYIKTCTCTSCITHTVIRQIWMNSRQCKQWVWTYLDLLSCVNNEHIQEVLLGPIHPVVEGLQSEAQVCHTYIFFTQQHTYKHTSAHMKPLSLTHAHTHSHTHNFSLSHTHTKLFFVFHTHTHIHTYIHTPTQAMLWKYTAYFYNVSALSPSVMLIHMEDATFSLILTVLDVQLQLPLYHCYV